MFGVYSSILQTMKVPFHKITLYITVCITLWISCLIWLQLQQFCYIHANDIDTPISTAIRANHFFLSHISTPTLSSSGSSSDSMCLLRVFLLHKMKPVTWKPFSCHCELLSCFGQDIRKLQSEFMTLLQILCLVYVSHKICGAWMKSRLQLQMTQESSQCL